MSIKDRVTEKQLNKLIEINCLWNARKLSASKAMRELWQLFDVENRALWNRHDFYKEHLSTKSDKLRRD